MKKTRAQRAPARRSVTRTPGRRERPDARAERRSATETPSPRKRPRHASEPGSATETPNPRKRPRDPAEQAAETPASAKRDAPAFIVGIGASAGGLKALESFFDNLSNDTGSAFVVVTHQHPTQPSLLPGLLERHTQMRVQVVGEQMPVEPNQVYVSSPGKNIAILQGHLHLMDVPKGPELHLPIDYFFKSLAHDQEERAICIVLSGTGTDGTLGLREIKAHAGFAIVQDEQSAHYAGMPHSAAATRLADCVLPPEQMPARLLAYSQSARRFEPAADPSDDQLDRALPKIFLLLRNRLGHDFSGYKVNTMRRRIERRMRVHEIDQPSDYIDFLQAEPHELDLLFRELLITVTQFFRDPDAFAVLRTQLAQRIRANEANGAQAGLRIWVAGCATGEEAYSLAILAIELLEHSDNPFQLQVLATDLDPHAIEYARAGLYPAGIAVDVGSERLKRFFVADGTGYRIKKQVRDRIVFANHNVLKDPPFTKLDLLACRNLMIYLNADVQQRLFPMFHYALDAGGILWLGTSENATGHAELFQPIDRQWKVYERRKPLPGPPPILDLRPAPIGPSIRLPPRSAPSRIPGIASSMQGVLFERFVPPTVVVNERGDITFIHGRTGDFLEPNPGEPRHNIFAMAREGLRLRLQAAIRTALTHKGEIKQRATSFPIRAGLESVTVIASRIVEPESLRGLVRVSFEAAPVPAAKKATAEPRSKRSASHAEHELKVMRESLQAALHELQTSNEELQSTNEEMQSANEELQSTNEELESSKEELQSLNEELQTVNSELQRKIDELAELNDDWQNMLNGTDIATLFLDRELRIKRFTEQARRVIRLIATDVGRPISDLTPQIRYDRLSEDAALVLQSLRPHEIEVQNLEGRWLLVRMLPYQTGQNRIDGLVITFIDIDRIKRAESLAASRALAESIVQSVRDPLLVLDAELHIVTSNRAFSRLIGLEPQQLYGRSIHDLGAERREFARLQPLLEEVVSQGRSIDALELESLGPSPVRLNARRLDYLGAEDPGLILVTLEEAPRAPS